MRAKLTLTAVIWNPNARRAKLAGTLQKNALILESRIKTRISDSNPAGKVYRRGAIVKKRTRANAGLPLRAKGNGFIVGYRFHRASAKGQPPAIDTGTLINSVRARAILQFKYRIGTSVVYAAILDDKNRLNRPFFVVVVESFRKEFLADVRAALRELIGKK